MNILFVWLSFSYTFLAVSLLNAQLCSIANVLLSLCLVLGKLTRVCGASCCRLSSNKTNGLKETIFAQIYERYNHYYCVLKWDHNFGSNLDGQTWCKDLYHLNQENYQMQDQIRINECGF